MNVDPDYLCRSGLCKRATADDAGAVFAPDEEEQIVRDVPALR